MNNLIEIKNFSKAYIDKIFRELVSTQNYNEFLLDKFPFEENYTKGLTGIYIDSKFSLDHTKDDLHNSIQIYENLKNLNETQASDERLWMFFVLGIAWDYMRGRWPLSNVDNPVNRIRDRYFLRTLKLETLTRNGISRLWWYAHLTYDKKRSNPYELTEIMLSRADLAVGITERALGSNKNIRTGILEFLAMNHDILKSEEKSRKLLTNLQLVGGVKNLPFLDIKDVISILEKVA